MAVDMGPIGVYQTFATGGAPVGGMMTKIPQSPHPFWTYYFTGPGARQALERTKARAAR